MPNLDSPARVAPFVVIAPGTIECRLRVDIQKVCENIDLTEQQLRETPKDQYGTIARLNSDITLLRERRLSYRRSLRQLGYEE